MAGVAVLAAEKGYKVVGYDVVFEPPMSLVLEGKGIQLITGYPEKLALKPGDQVIVANQFRRFHPLMTSLIAMRKKLYSAPEWLLEHVLRDRKVIAVAGAHGKTTITSMLSWVLKACGQKPGYLIGGVVEQLGGCAALGEGEYFVIEADEYDSAFFDKRPKFIHYWPVMLVISHVEYDHADIYPDMKSLLKQYGYLLRLLPGDASIFTIGIPNALLDVVHSFSLRHVDYGREIDSVPNLKLKMKGSFNHENAKAVYLVGKEIGLQDKDIQLALAHFSGPMRRQTLMVEGDITAYDDYAHHPTELKQIIDNADPKALIVVYHPATFTQRSGIMDAAVIAQLSRVKQGIVLLPPKHHLNVGQYQEKGILLCENERKVMDVLKKAEQGDVVVVMSAQYLSALWQGIVKCFKREIVVE